MMKRSLNPVVSITTHISSPSPNSIIINRVTAHHAVLSFMPLRFYVVPLQPRLLYERHLHNGDCNVYSLPILFLVGHFNLCSPAPPVGGNEDFYCLLNRHTILILHHSTPLMLHHIKKLYDHIHSQNHYNHHTHIQFVML